MQLGHAYFTSHVVQPYVVIFQYSRYILPISHYTLCSYVTPISHHTSYILTLEFFNTVVTSCLFHITRHAVTLRLFHNTRHAVTSRLFHITRHAVTSRLFHITCHATLYASVFFFSLFFSEQLLRHAYFTLNATQPCVSIYQHSRYVTAISHFTSCSLALEFFSTVVTSRLFHITHPAVLLLLFFQHIPEAPAPSV